MLRRIDQSVQLVSVAIIIALMAIMTATVVLGVFYRYILNDPLSWTEEIARYSMVWVSVLGGGMAFRRGGHVAVTFVVDMFPQVVGKTILLLGNLGTLIFLALMFWYGWDMLGRVEFQRSAALRFSMWYPYAAIPVGAALMIYHMLVVMWFEVVRGEKHAVQTTGV